MSEGHRHAERFDFEIDRHTGVFVCRRVVEGAPVLYVSHDDDGDWQFLCGGSHGEGEGDGAQLRCLECVVADDPSLNDVADLCCDWFAERAHPGAAWTRVDRLEDVIREGIEEHGWYCINVGAGEDGPAFAYTIGLPTTFGHPELICVGLRAEVMHAMFDGCVTLLRAGRPPPVGPSFAGILDGFDVRLREVRASDSLRQLVYARWFHGEDVAVLQLVWPDKEHRFPGDPGVNPILATQQPVLP